MQVKKSIKKVGAVAGSALMVGMTFGAAAPLADFPQPFVDEDGQVQSQIVVGSQGKVADVVGAINIGASVGQAAVQTTENTVPGAESAEVDGKQFDDALRGAGVSNQWIDKSDYSQLARKTVTDANDEDHRVLEQLGVQGTVNDNVGSNSSDVLGNVGDGAVQYTVSYTPGFNVDQEIEVMGDNYQVTGVTQDSDGNAQLKLGSKLDQDSLELGDTFDHGPYTVEVVDKDESAGSSGAIYVEVSKNGEVLRAVGLEEGSTETFDNDALELTADDVFFGSKRDYIDITSTYTDTELTSGAEESPFSDDWSVVSLSGTGYNDTESAGTVTGFTLQNDVHTVSNPGDTDDEDDRDYLNAGEAIPGPSDYFSLTYQGLTDEDTEELTVKDENKVSFTDVEGFDHTLDATTIADNFDAGTQFYDDNSAATVEEGVYTVDVRGHPVQVEVDDGDTAGDGVFDVTVSYKSFSAEGQTDPSGASGDAVIAETSTGYGFNIQVNQVIGEIVDDDGTAGNEADIGLSVNDGDTTNLAVNTAADGDNTDGEFHTAQGHEFGYDGTNDVLEVTEGGDANGAGTTEAHATADATVTVNYAADSDTATVDEVSYDTGSGLAVQHDSSGEEGRTTHGSVVSTGASNVGPVTLEMPENALNAQFALGSTETTSGSDQTYRAVDASAQGNLPSMAMLDSDVQESHKANNHLILVGGPAVNTLVSDLVDSGDVDLSELEGQGSGALIQGVNDAFADGQHALVVAGVNAADTRSAAQYISNYASHEQGLSNAGDRLVLAEADYPSEQ